MSSFLVAAAQEAEEIKKSLSALEVDYKDKCKPLIERLALLRDIEVAWGGGESKPQGPSSTTLKSRVLAAAREVLKSGPMRTVHLVTEIEQRGVIFTASNKAGNLSVILSKDDSFVGHRKNGWSLAEEKNPQDAPTSAGSIPAQAGFQLTAPKQGN